MPVDMLQHLAQCIGEVDDVELYGERLTTHLRQRLTKGEVHAVLPRRAAAVALLDRAALLVQARVVADELVKRLGCGNILRERAVGSLRTDPDLVRIRGALR